jgi:hypothetical protein
MLVLGQRKQNGDIAGGKYPVAPEMAARLRQVAVDTMEKLERADMSEYDGATLLDPEQGLWVPTERLRAEAPLLDFLAGIDDDEEPISADEAQSLSLSFYAIAFGPDDDRIFFVRQKASNLHATGKTIFGLIDAPMRLVTEPILTLDTTIDFISTDAGAAVFNAYAFERFIQDPAEIEGNLEATIDDLSRQLPLSAGVVEALKSKGVESLSMRGRVRSILGRPYFRGLTIDIVREKIVSKNLDPTLFIRDGRLTFEARHTMFVLKLLDQKVWKGDFDDTLYSTNAATPERP